MSKTKLERLKEKNSQNTQAYKSAFNDIKYIKIDDIKTNPYQPRKEFNEQSIKELSESIKEDGLMNALSVTENNILIAGEQRLRACKILELEVVECRIIKNIDDDKLERLAIVENVHRNDLTMIDLSVAIGKLVKNDSVRNVAKMLSKSRGYIQDRVILSKIDDEAKKYVIENNIGLKNTIKIVENGLDFFKKTIESTESKGGGFLKDTKNNPKKPEDKLDINKIETSNEKEKYTPSNNEINLKKNYKTHNFEIFFDEKNLLIRVDKNKVNSNLLLKDLIDNRKIQNESN